jgi:hypothetical protein
MQVDEPVPQPPREEPVAQDSFVFEPLVQVPPPAPPPLPGPIVTVETAAGTTVTLVPEWRPPSLPDVSFPLEFAVPPPAPLAPPVLPVSAPVVLAVQPLRTSAGVSEAPAPALAAIRQGPPAPLPQDSPTFADVILANVLRAARETGWQWTYKSGKAFIAALLSFGLQHCQLGNGNVTVRGALARLPSFKLLLGMADPLCDMEASILGYAVVATPEDLTVAAGVDPATQRLLEAASFKVVATDTRTLRSVWSGPGQCDILYR